MAKTLVNLQQSLAQVEAKLTKLHHYRDYLISRIAGLSDFSQLLGDDSVVAVESQPVCCGSWAKVTTIRVADGISAAAALADPTIKLLRPSRISRDLDEFVRNHDSSNADERFECWATLFAWWRVAIDREDEPLQSQVVQAMSLSGIDSSDDRIERFDQFVRTFILEDSAKAHPDRGVTD